MFQIIIFGWRGIFWMIIFKIKVCNAMQLTVIVTSLILDVKWWMIAQDMEFANPTVNVSVIQSGSQRTVPCIQWHLMMDTLTNCQTMDPNITASPSMAQQALQSYSTISIHLMCMWVRAAPQTQLSLIMISHFKMFYTCDFIHPTLKRCKMLLDTQSLCTATPTMKQQTNISST